MPEFDKQWNKYNLTDTDLKDLEAFLCDHPDSGRLIRKTGGLRKLRWALPSKGKSGGIRVLYVDFTYFKKIYMISCFSKNTKISLTDNEKNQARLAIETIKNNLRRKRL